MAIYMRSNMSPKFPIPLQDVLQAGIKFRRTYCSKMSATSKVVDSSENYSEIA